MTDEQLSQDSQESQNSQESQQAPVQAVIERSRFHWSWLLPLLALVAAGWLLYAAWSNKGTLITVSFQQGHGLQVGAALRHHGIDIGTVEQVQLAPESGVRVAIRLQAEAADLARAGTRFWIVRPRISTQGIAGLDTLIGAQYLGILPGDGAPKRFFTGLEEEPVLHGLKSGGLEILLQADRRGSLSPGAPVLFRQITVGKVLSLGLASDGSSVEVRTYIEPDYADLVRSDSKFWNASGIRIDVGLGLTIEAESLQTLLMGGIAFATPGIAGKPVSTGHRFTLDPRGQEEWMEWQPPLRVGPQNIGKHGPLPIPQRVSISWSYGRLWTSTAGKNGWALITEGGLLAIEDLLVAPESAHENTVSLALLGESFQLKTAPKWQKNGLALLPLAPAALPWKNAQLRAPQQPEDCYVIGDPSNEPVMVAAPRLRIDDETSGWLIDDAVHFSKDWHGAVCVAVTDGAVIGFIDRRTSEPVIRLIP